MTAADLWTVIPLLLLGCGALLILVLGAFVPGRYTTGVGIAASLGAALWALQVPPAAVAPHLGMAFTPFSRYFVVLFCLTAVVTLLISHDFVERRNIHGEEYPATILFAAFGMCAVAGAGNLLILFLGLESLTFAFYILVAIDRDDNQGNEAGLKYLLSGAAAAAFIAFGLALIYAGTGVLSLATAVKGLASPGEGGILVFAGWCFLLSGIAFKVSLVPFHLWTPDVYQGAPAPVVAFLSTGSKAATFTALLLLLIPAGANAPLLRPLLLALSLLSMVVGNLAALRQANVKRMLAYSSIAQMGYVALALLSGGRAGYGAVAFYAAAYAAMNLAAFGAIGVLTQEGEESVEGMKGMGYRRPFPAAVLAFSMLALAGIPPTAGFTGKFAIFAAALKGGETAAAIIGILTAVVSVYYYLRVVVSLYLHDAEAAETNAPAPSAAETAGLVAASAAILLLGILPGTVMDFIDYMLQ